MSESEVEEMNQTEIKDYNNKEEVFPGHLWEPRVKEEDITRILKHTPVPYVEAINMDNRHQRWGYRYLYEMYEPMMWFWRTAEWDLEEQKIRKKTKKGEKGKKIEEVENVAESGNWTPWIIILLDFFYTTGMPIDRKNDMRIKAVKRREECEENLTKYKKMTEEMTPMREMNMKELEFYFIKASRQMWKILQMEENNETHTKKQLRRLGSNIKSRRKQKIGNIRDARQTKSKGPGTSESYDAQISHQSNGNGRRRIRPKKSNGNMARNRSGSMERKKRNDIQTKIEEKH